MKIITDYSARGKKEKIRLLFKVTIVRVSKLDVSWYGDFRGATACCSTSP